MQVAISNNIYTQAQMYAERKGQDLSAMIERYLLLYIQRNNEAAKDEIPDVVASLLGAGKAITNAHTIEISPRVASLLTGQSWNVSEEELDDMRYKYLAEKYK